MTNIEPSWDLYRSFLAVLRTGSLSGAAKALGVAQPTVGRHIAELEAAMGLPLFTRSQQGLTPTDAALQLRPYAEDLASTAAALLREASSRGSEVIGAVRLTASEVVGVEILPPILAALRRKHPRLVIELIPSNRAQDLLSREADIAVRMFQPTQHALVTRKVGEVELGWHAHEDYLAHRGTPKAADDLLNHDLIGFDHESDFLRGFLKLLGPITRAHFALRTDSDLAHLAAIRCGYGIGVCQANIASRDKPLVRVLPKAFKPKLGMWVTMHENLKASLRCRVVFDGLVEELSKRM